MLLTNTLILKEALLEIVGKMPLDWEYGQAVSDIYKIIEEAPGIEAEPVVHGEWEIDDDGCERELMRCSVCGEECYDGDNDIIVRFYNYCPNCGAKMDGEPQ